MKKIVTVIAVCLAGVIMVGSDVHASATKATTEKSDQQCTIIDEEYIVTGEIGRLGKSKKTGGKNKKTSKKTAVSAELSDNKEYSAYMNSMAVTYDETAMADNNDVLTNNEITDADDEAIPADSGTNVSDNENTVSALAASEKKKGIEKNKKNKYTPAELKYMTSIIYCEARGEGYAGQMAVGIVVMNRMKSDDFPDTIKKVIYQKGQFTPTVNGSMTRALNLYEKYNDNGKFKGEMVSCYKAAKEVLSGTTTIKVDGKDKEMKGYLYFSQHISGAKYTLGGHQFK